MKADIPDDDGVGLALGGEEAIWQALVKFRKEQERFMPELWQTLSSEERHPLVENAYKTPLFMPSDMGEDDPPAPLSLIRLEAHLRLENMHASIENLKRFLSLRVAYNKHKIRNITGQRGNTRARSAQATTEKRISGAAASYRRHRAAYKLLVVPGAWSKEWPELESKHIVGLGDRKIQQLNQLSARAAALFLQERAAGKNQPHEKRTGSKQTVVSAGESAGDVSWIWYKTPKAGDGLDVTPGKDGVRVLAQKRKRLTCAR